MLTSRTSAKWLRRFRDDQDGVTLVGAGFGLVVLLGVAAIAIDMGYMYVKKNQLQFTADSAASAAAAALPNAANALSMAQAIAEKNMPTASDGTVLATADFEIGVWDQSTRVFTATTTSPNAIRATVRRSAANNNPVTAFFANMMGFQNVDVTAQSTALQQLFSAPCILSLEPSASQAIRIRSNAFIDISGCGVHINSSSSNALDMESNAVLHDSGTCINGGLTTGSNVDIAPPATTGCGVKPDPLASLPTPVYDGHGHEIATHCDYTNFSVEVHSAPPPLQPGIYCGGINISNNNTTTNGFGITLSSGMYVIKNGPFHTDANTTITGTGVFLYYTGTGALNDMNSNSSIDLTAPTTGTYAGILMFQDRNYGGTHVMDSNSNKRFVGAIYFPQGDIMVHSNSVIASNSPCTMLIARRFTFNANAGVTGSFDLNPSSTSCSVPIPTAMQTGATSRVVN